MFLFLYLSTFCMDISIFSSACSNSATNITTKIPCRSSAGVPLSVCVCTEPLQFHFRALLRILCKKLQRRLRTIHFTDLVSSPFYNDIFVWDEIFKGKNDHLGHFFHCRHVRQLIDRHESYLLRWISFVETN